MTRQDYRKKTYIKLGNQQITTYLRGIKSQLKNKNMKIEALKLDNQGLEQKTMWYLMVTNQHGENMTLNVGQKTYERVTKLNENDTMTATEWKKKQEAEPKKPKK